MSSLGGTAARTTSGDQGDGSDPDDVVQPSNESRRTAPPEESAADHAIHVEGGTAAPSNYSPNDLPNVSSKFPPRLFNYAHSVE
jgi:hypothetical protein